MSLQDTREHANCLAMSDVLNRIGDKWSVMVVGMLSRHGTLRFNELKRQINGVSQRMLTLTLRNLERDGLVTRAIFPRNSPPGRIRTDRTGQHAHRPHQRLVGLVRGPSRRHSRGALCL